MSLRDSGVSTEISSYLQGTHVSILKSYCFLNVLERSTQKRPINKDSSSRYVRLDLYSLFGISNVWALPCTPKGIKSYVKQCQNPPKTFFCSRCIPGSHQPPSLQQVPGTIIALPWQSWPAGLAFTLLCPSCTFLPF